MASPRQIAAARRASDRWDRTRAMAEIYRDGIGGISGTVQVADLRRAGFTDAEIFGYADDVRSILSDRPGAGEPDIPPARIEGLILVAEARRQKARQQRTAGQKAGQQEDGHAVENPAIAESAQPAPARPEPVAPPADSVLREPPPRRRSPFDSGEAVLRRMGDLLRSVLLDIEEQGMVLIPRAELEARDRRAAEAGELREALARLLGRAPSDASVGASV